MAHAFSPYDNQHPTGRRLLRLAACLLLLSPLAAVEGRQADLPRRQSAQQGAPAAPSPQSNDEVLQPGRPLTRTLAGGRAHRYRCRLEPGQFMLVVVEQRGIDVVLDVSDAGGKRLAEADSPNGSEGPEEMGFIAERAGEYGVGVRSTDEGAGPGGYQITLAELRAATEKDRSYVAAAAAFAEAFRLYFRDTRESILAAVAKLEASVPLWQAVGNRAKEADALDGIGTMYSKLGENRKALDYYNRALPLKRAAGDLRGEAATLSNVGLIYSDISENAAALDYYNRALALQRRTGDKVGQGITLNNIAVVYGELGESQLALDHYLQSFDVAPQNDGGTLLHNIGTLYDALGDKRKAADYFNRALALRRSGGNRRGEGQTLNSIGKVYGDLGEHAAALDYYRQSLALRQALGDRRGAGVTLNNIGVLYQRTGELRKAAEYLGQSLAINREVGNRRVEAHTLEQLGRVHEVLGEPQKALDSYRQALALRRAIADRGGEAETLARLARFERAAGDLAAARAHVEGALAVVESLRGRIASPELRTSYSASVGDFHELYIDVLMRQHARQPSARHDAVALRASESARARGLLDLLYEARADIRQGADPALLARERSLARLLNARAERQTRLLSGPHTEQEAAAAAQELLAATTEYEQVQGQIRLRSPRYAALTQPQPLGPEEIQARVLDPDTLLLEYALGDERSYLWAVTADSLASFELPGRAEVERAARRFYELLTARNRPAPGETAEQGRARVARADAALPAASAALSQMVLGPAASRLGNKRLLVVADGALQYVPFAALPAPAADPRAPAGARPPLVAEHEVVSLPSASTLAVLRRELEGRRAAPKAVAVLADPVFDKDDERVRRSAARAGRRAGATAEAPVPADLLRALEDVGDGEAPRRLPRLYNTRSEAEVISSLVPAAESMRALDFEANRAAATSPGLSRYRVVHFATHAFVNNAHPELSGIVLSLVDERGRPQDGFLRLHEIFNLKLPAELVVLSACRTGLGKEVRGEGLIGLTRGFMYAGAPRVVVSLWSLSDRPTAELMARFYRKMLGGGRLAPSAALRAAQVEMREDARWGHPYFWAAFTLQGEWR